MHFAFSIESFEYKNIKYLPFKNNLQLTIAIQFFLSKV